MPDHVVPRAARIRRDLFHISLDIRQIWTLYSRSSSLPCMRERRLMDPERFDDMIRIFSMSESRRRALRAVLAAVGVVISPWSLESSEGKNRRRHRRQSKHNARTARVSADKKKKKKKNRNQDQPTPEPVPTPTPPPVIPPVTPPVPPAGCPAGQTPCGASCVTLGTIEHCLRCDDRCPSSPCETATCDATRGCARTARTGNASCGDHHFCTAGACIDYDFPNTLKFPWCAGEKEPRGLTQDWVDHDATGLALDFGRSQNEQGVQGPPVRGTLVLAPMAGTVRKVPDSGTTLGNFVEIDAGNGWVMRLAHLEAIDENLGDIVSTGDIVGTLGDNGLVGTPDCLHGCPHIHADLFIKVGKDQHEPLIERIANIYGHALATFRCADTCSYEQAFVSTQRTCEGDCEGMQCAAFSDDFDDNSIDTAHWSVYQQSCGASLTETNQRLEIAFPANTSGTCVSGVVSTCRLRGDFDIRVDYHLLEWPSLNGVRIALAGNFPGPPAVERTSRNGQEVYLTDFDDNIQGITATNDTEGAFRLVRRGNTVTGYYRSGAGWEEVHTGPTTTNDIPFDLRAWTQANEFSRKGVRIAFDNLVIDEGSLICPE